MRIRDAVLLPDGRVLRGRFDGLTIISHWATVLPIAFLFVSGWSFAVVEGTALFVPLLMLHRSAGAAVWGARCCAFCGAGPSRRSLRFLPICPR